MPPRNQQIEPALTPLRTTPGVPGPAQDVVEAVHPPDREEVRHRAAHDPDDVLVEDGALDVVEVRHREELEGREVEARHACGLGHTGREVFRVAYGRTDVQDAGAAAVGARQFDRVMHQGVERHHGPAAPGAVTAGGGEDGGLSPVHRGRSGCGGNMGGGGIMGCRGSMGRGAGRGHDTGS